MRTGISKGGKANSNDRLTGEAGSIVGLSALWPALALGLAMLVGCKTTKHVAEVQDPFLPTKTVALPQDGQPVIVASSTEGVPNGRQVDLASYQPK